MYSPISGLIAKNAFCPCSSHLSFTSFFVRLARGLISTAHKLMLFLMKFNMPINSLTMHAVVKSAILRIASMHFFHVFIQSLVYILYVSITRKFYHRGCKHALHSIYLHSHVFEKSKNVFKFCKVFQKFHSLCVQDVTQVWTR